MARFNLRKFSQWSTVALTLLFLATGLEATIAQDAPSKNRFGNVDLSGFPNATNTGVPPGVVLKSSGSLVITTPGAVVEGLDIKGSVVIDAPNVTLKNCKVTDAGYDVVLIKPGIIGVTIQNCEISNEGVGGQGIAGQGTFLRNNIHDCADGIDVRGDNTLIEEIISTRCAVSRTHTSMVSRRTGNFLI